MAAQTREVAPLAISALALFVIAILSYRDWEALGRLRDLTDSSQQTVLAASDLLSTLKDSETGQRGFLLTGRTSYLEPHKHAVSTIPQILNRLTVLAKNSTDQSRRVEALKPLVKAKLDELRQTIDVFQSQGPEAARAIVLSDRGKDTMDRIRQIDTELGDVANNRMTRESEAVRSVAGRTQLVSVAGSALIFALLIAATISINREMRRKQALIATLAQSEAELRASQQLFESVINNSTAVIFVKDLSGHFSLINRRYEEVFHVKREQMAQKTDYDIFPPDRADAFRAADRRVITSGQILESEEVVAMEDGLHTFLATKFPLRNGAGEAYAVGGISTDITERKRAEQRLRAQVDQLGLLDQITRAIGERQDLRSIFQVVIRTLEDSLPIDFGCLCLSDSSRRTLTVTCVGVHSEELASQLAMTEHAEVTIDENGLSRCVQGHLVYEPDLRALDFPFPRRLASAGLCSVVFAPLLSESQVFGVLVAARLQPGSFSSTDCEFLRQLSEHVALAARQAQIHNALQQAYDDLRLTQQSVMQQDRLRSLGQMASGIAHDINNAVSPMAVYTESLLEKEPDLSPHVREYLEIAQRTLGDVAQTVSRMQEFYREREPHLMLKAVKLNPLIQQVLDLTRARWRDMPQQRGITIEARTDLAHDLPEIAGIESEIREALVNLILNAVDAMPDGGAITLRTKVSANKAPSSGLRHVHVEVSDTGVGMNEETRRRCLEPFFTTKGERGSGLGLAMVFGVMRRHQAEVEIESTPGEGTSVVLVLPERDVTATEPVPSRSDDPVVRHLRILLADDDPLILKVLREAIESDGHVVITANGGQECIDAFLAAESAKRFDLVITDLGMPRVDGRRVSLQVKAARSSAPVILLTGWGERLVAEGEVPPHVDFVLSKPPKLRDLRNALAELTHNSTRAAGG